ncbi:DUF317 domain-containing protein [Streptomyces celluloflavus]|uniref:DUF317 domain-containing protein n=1 Tax=Streptomyces celluloflavus TaxID=58344 RepID=UPI00345F7691|nr:DUF317 domain-containing protein [Streptomyces celluloflavus]
MSHEHFYSRVNGPTIHRVNQVRYLDEVAPRHLAGGGDPRHVTEYLLVAGWSNHSVPGYPHVLLESPDRQLHLTLEPTAPEERDTWWRIHPAERTSWSAHFGGHTPVEIIAGFTDALTHQAPRAKTETTDLWHIAASRGWPKQLEGTDQAALSPDETAILARVQAPTLHDTPTWRWKAEVSVPLTEGRRRWLWGASIDDTAPAAALGGFVAALTDPTPLLRDEGQTTGHTFGYLNSTRSAVSPEHNRRLHLQRLEAAQRTRPPQPPPAGRTSPPGPAHRRKRR